MADKEMTGRRDLTISYWHRTRSIARFVGGIEIGQRLSMIDIDGTLFLEYERGTYRPLVLFEYAILKSHGKPDKATGVIESLARRANLPAFLVFYTISENENRHADGNGVRDIDSFLVKKLFPDKWIEFRLHTPEQFGQLILKERKEACRELDEQLLPNQSRMEDQTTQARLF